MTPSQTDTGAVPGVCEQTSGESDEQKNDIASRLVVAWSKYVQLFGESPHGTEKQLRALTRLMPPPARQENLLGRETDLANDSIKREIAYDQILTLARELGGVTEKLMASEKERRTLARKSAKDARTLAALQPSKE